MDIQADGRPREGTGAPRRVSLRKIDALIQGELPEAEAAALRAALETDPAGKAYLERQGALRSDLTAMAIRSAIAQRERAFLPRLLALCTGADAGADPSRRGFALGMAGAAFACLALGLGVWTAKPHRGPAPEEAYRMKGERSTEVMLRVRGRDYAPGDLIPAAAGDTLGFAYRSGDAVQVQVWYQEDDRTPAPFSGPGGFALPYAPGWQEASQRVVLEGAWARQQVWILLSPEPLSAEEAARAVRRGKDGDGVRVLAFRLAAPPKG